MTDNPRAARNAGARVAPELMRRLVASRLGATASPPSPRGRRPGSLVTLDDALDAYAADRRVGKRLAVAITGGGARGAWEAGVIEALTAACRERQIAIDVVVGASVGSINALCTFVDALVPVAAPVDGLFSARQSRFWKRYADGNQGADQLLDLSWLIPYATNQLALPGPEMVSDGLRRLETAWDTARGRLGDIGRAAGRVRRSATSRPRGNLTEGTGLALQQLDIDTQTLLRHGRDLEAAWRNLHFQDLFLDPAAFSNELQSVGDVLGDLAGDLGRVDVDLISVPLSLVGDGIIDLFRYLGPLVLALEDLVAAILPLIGDAGEMLGALGEIETAIATAVLLLGFCVSIARSLLVGGFLVNHIFTQDKLRQALLGFTVDALGESHSIVRAWREQSGHRPALYVAGTDLSCKRQIVFALDRRERLDELAASGVWVVDLAHQNAPTDTVLTPNSRMVGDLAVEATLSSAALPIAFPPTTWYLDRVPAGAPTAETLRQVVVDGGVVDNSPLDLAVLAGATHVLLLELNPLVDAIEPQVKWDSDAPGGLLQVVWDTMNTAIDGGNRRGVELVVALNSLLPSNQRVVVHRFAPLIPREAYPHDGRLTKVSIDIIDFNGAYNNSHNLVMNLYDWFVQGFIDARGWGPADAGGAQAVDVVLQDYYATLDAGFVHDPWWGSNKLWRCGSQPLPSMAELATNVNLPDRRALADVAAAR
jgi:predicted acylesterase/phospholipase RssA